MKKKTFISKNFRPDVTGSRLIPEDSHLREEDPVQANEKKFKKASICIGPKTDMVVALLRDYLVDDESFEFLNFEDIGQKWWFSFSGDDFLFETPGHVIKARALYFRGVTIDEADAQWEDYCLFIAALNAWKGFVLCRPNLQLANESKPYQMLTTLRTAIGSTEKNIKFPVTYILKGRPEILHALRLERRDLIVKSVSAVRSIVKSDEEFMTWDLDALQNLPVLFQEKISGTDIRIHHLAGESWGRQVAEKSDVDYRYAEQRSEMILFEVTPELEAFCRSAAAFEKNNLVGLDFLEKDGTYYCLEMNPGPGWAWYHRREISPKNFVEKFVEVFSDNGNRSFVAA